jgi:hypothetical protein
LQLQPSVRRNSSEMTLLHIPLPFALLFWTSFQQSHLATLTCGSSFLLAGPLPTHFISGRPGEKRPGKGFATGKVGAPRGSPVGKSLPGSLPVYKKIYSRWEPTPLCLWTIGNRVRSRFSVVAICNELRHEHCSLVGLGAPRSYLFLLCAELYARLVWGGHGRALKRRWSVYLKLGLLGR